MTLIAGSLTALLAFTACSTPKHSNVLMFGTNTQAGINVSFDPRTQEPGVIVGYKRQEAVWMPLLANVTHPTPPPPDPAPPTTADLNTNGGLLYLGKQVAGANHDADTYSVLASFGAKFEASGAKSDGIKTSGGLAQFFATGLAARKLAEQGGEALVSVQTSEAPAKAREAVAISETAKATAAVEKSLNDGRNMKTEDSLLVIGFINKSEDAGLAAILEKAVTAKLPAAADIKAQNLVPTVAADAAKLRQALIKATYVGDNATDIAALHAFRTHLVP